MAGHARVSVTKRKEGGRVRMYEIGLQEWAAKCHDVAKDKGFWEGTIDANFILAKLALVASEVSEVLEAYRKEKGRAEIADEMADIFIRLVDLYAGMQEHGIIDKNLWFEDVVESKYLKNKSRPRKHGNLI